MKCATVVAKFVGFSYVKDINEDPFTFHLRIISIDNYTAWVVAGPDVPVKYGDVTVFDFAL